MRLIFKMLALSFFLVITGCATKEPIVVYKSILLSPPDTFLVNCDIEPPPNKKEYKTGSEKDREVMLFSNLNKQMTNLFICNARLTELREWKRQQKEILGDIMPIE